MSVRSLAAVGLVAVSIIAWSAALARAQRAEKTEALIFFKDGFYLRGQVKEEKKIIVDPGGGHVYIPSGKLIHLDDGVRRIFFVMSQLQEVMSKKQVMRKEDMMKFERTYATGGANKHIFPGWEFGKTTDWDAKWERTIKVTVEKPFKGSFPMTQRMVRMTPESIFIQTLTHNWDLYYFTKEFEAQEIRVLLDGHFSTTKETKDMKAFDKRLNIAKFLHTSGWLNEAERDLDNLAEEFPVQMDAIAGVRNQLKSVWADRYVEGLEQAYKIGQHFEAQERIRVFEKLELHKVADPKNAVIVQDLKNKYDAEKDKLAQATNLLKKLPPRVLVRDRTFWNDASAMILEELNLDTLPRLELFTSFGQQHAKELDENRKPAQTTEEVLAMAVTGWLLGNGSSEPDPKMARQLFLARDFVLKYLRSNDLLGRKQMGESFSTEFSLTIDALARLVRQLPPPFPYDQSGNQAVKLDIEVPDSNGGSYQIQLPPDYHHYRPHPVLVVMHGSSEKPLDMLNRWSAVAAQHGFIVVAPQWGKGLQSLYGYSSREHDLVLDTLRDVRRRFNVDSDRVFLFGWEQGAEAALDIAGGHPDQFAGVLPMSIYPRYFPEKCWSNFQYLPMYLVDADRSSNAKAVYDYFKKFTSNSYPALYMLYKGRAIEFFPAEMPTMMDWMTRKKRHHPSRQLGRYATGGVEGEEFKTMRECDNKFYWLSTDQIDDRCLNSPGADWNRFMKPATLQCTIAQGNESIKKDGVVQAKIWSQIRIRAHGVKQVTLWFTPTMHEFSNLVEIRMNDTRLGAIRTLRPDPAVLLEELHRSGDRQRLFYAKVELK